MTKEFFSNAFTEWKQERQKNALPFEIRSGNFAGYLPKNFPVMVGKLKVLPIKWNFLVRHK